MDIYILRDGKEIGPLSEETTKTLLQQGSVLMGDFAWCPGMSDWGPLSDVLKPASAIPPAPAPQPAAEPATEKQKAFFSYLGIAFSPDLTKDQASILVNDAMEDSRNTERLRQWGEDRLRLHPDLFAAEIQAKRENRAHHFFELCQTQGAEYFTKITKAHCQVLVGFLDVKFPNWDAREAEAAVNYFYPAVAEKFPQLVQKQWRGKFHYAEGQKVAAEITRKAPTAKLKKPGASPIAALARGVVFGILILGLLYLVHRIMQDGPARPSPANEPSEPAASVVPQPMEASPPVPVQPVVNPAPPAEPAKVAPKNEPAPAKTATVTAPAADPGMNPATIAPADPAMSPMAMNAAPMAALPGTEPPVPVAPPAATLPAPATMANLNPDPAPAPTAAAPPPGADSARNASARTSLLLTKPVEIPSPYGTIKLGAGTPVKLLARQGSSLKVGYLNNIFIVPTTSTDLEADAAPVP
jgi:hypothetical protein